MHQNKNEDIFTLNYFVNLGRPQLDQFVLGIVNISSEVLSQHAKVIFKAGHNLLSVYWIILFIVGFLHSSNEPFICDFLSLFIARVHDSGSMKTEQEI